MAHPSRRLRCDSKTSFQAFGDGVQRAPVRPYTKAHFAAYPAPYRLLDVTGSGVARSVAGRMSRPTPVAAIFLSRRLRFSPRKSREEDAHEHQKISSIHQEFDLARRRGARIARM